MIEKEIDNNVNGYKTMLQIEIGLREFIISRFNVVFCCSNWVKDPDGPLSLFSQRTIKSEEKINLFTKIEDSRKYALVNGWNPIQAQSTHGLYFLLFTDLQPILEKKYKKTNGELLNVFNFNLREKSAIISAMISIYPIRNKLAHSVFISELELSIINQFKYSLLLLIPNFETYINNSVQRENIYSKIGTCISVIMQLMISNSYITNEYEDLQKSLKIFDIELNEKYIKGIKIIEEYNELKDTKGSSIHISNLLEDNIDIINSFNI